MTLELKRVLLVASLALGLAAPAALAQPEAPPSTPRPSAPLHCPSAANNPCDDDAMQKLLEKECSLTPRCKDLDTKKDCNRFPDLAGKAQACHQGLLDCAAVVGSRHQQISEGAAKEREDCQERYQQCSPRPNPVKGRNF